MCGEKIMKRFAGLASKGSPPRVRGKASGVVYVASAEEDHPRVCGEKFLPRAAAWRKIGSPPRVRGKGLERLLLFPFSGITPACAGKRKTVDVNGRIM